MEHIEPILSPLLMNYLMAIGLIEQTGANKSLIARQEVIARRQLKIYRDSFARQLKNSVLRYITDKDVDICFEPSFDTEEITTLWNSSAVSREYIQNYLGVVDDGNTYVPINQSSEMSKSEDDSNADNEDADRDEKTDKTVRGT